MARKLAFFDHYPGRSWRAFGAKSWREARRCLKLSIMIKTNTYGFGAWIILFGSMAACKTAHPARSRVLDADTAGDSGSAADLQSLEDPNQPGNLDLSKSPGETPDLTSLAASPQDPPKLSVIEHAMSGVDDYYALTQCKKVRASGHPTAECTDLCDTFRPEAGLDRDLVWSTWLGWTSYFPDALRTAIGEGVAAAVGQEVSAPTARRVMCVPIVLAYLAAEVHDTMRCYKGSNCVACGADAAPRRACRIWDAVRVCAQTMGVKIPLGTPVGLLARSCSAATYLQREAYRNICLNQCNAATAAAVPIATAESFTQPGGTPAVRRRCCRCVREHRQAGWFTSPVIKSDFYNSVTEATDQPTEDCEGRTGKSVYPEDYFVDGQRMYYRFDRCEKYFVASDSCPNGDAFDPYKN